jgi:very-short-patch-repair endonuclease
LCIELDGEVHDSEEVRQKDADRTVFLKENKIKVLRFRNEEVETDIEDVLKRIRLFINQDILGNGGEK